MDSKAFNYALDNNIPQLVDEICKRLLESQPEDPYASVLRFLSARREGSYVGGAVLAGTNVGGGWLRVFSDDGSQRAAVDKLEFASEGEMQLVAACGSSQNIFLACAPDKASPNTQVRKYSFDGEHLDTYDFERAIACIGVDCARHQLWIVLKDGGGAILNCFSGAYIKEFTVPPCRAFVFTRDRRPSSIHEQMSVWLLTNKAIEKRDAESLRVEFAISLPDSVAQPATILVAAMSYIWCASSNPDGICNYVLGYGVHSGQPSSFIPPPTGVIAVDSRRSGTWHLSTDSLVFMNEAGRKLMAAELSPWRKANICVDKGSGLVWLYTCVDTQGSTLSLYNPYTQKCTAVHSVPATEGRTTFLIPI